MLGTRGVDTGSHWRVSGVTDGQSDGFSAL